MQHEVPLDEHEICIFEQYGVKRCYMQEPYYLQKIWGKQISTIRIRFFGNGYHPNRASNRSACLGPANSGFRMFVELIRNKQYRYLDCRSVLKSFEVIVDNCNCSGQFGT